MVKEYQIRVQNEDEKVILALMEKLGVEVTSLPKKIDKIKTARNIGKKINSTVDKTWLFGKWQDLEIDAKQLRETVWERNQKF
jgi:GTP-binding protein EngB required for normal cell division